MRLTVQCLLVIFVALGLATSCGRSTADVEKDVEAAISTEMAKDGITVDSVTLVKKSKNEYTGFVELSDDSGEALKADLEVTFDGDQFIWKIQK
jgi:hypothetical protein